MSDDWRGPLVDRVRVLISSADPEITEERKWRKPTNPEGVATFYADGLLCTVEPFKGKVKVTFARGASLEDPDQLFNASLEAGKSRAYDVFSPDDLDDEKFVRLVREAVAFNRG